MMTHLDVFPIPAYFDPISPIHVWLSANFLPTIASCVDYNEKSLERAGSVTGEVVLCSGVGG